MVNYDHDDNMCFCVSSHCSEGKSAPVAVIFNKTSNLQYSMLQLWQMYCKDCEIAAFEFLSQDLATWSSEWTDWMDFWVV